MIREHRNRAIWRLSAGYGMMFFAMFVIVLSEETQARKVWQASATIVAILGLVIYSFGCASLAEAKGYSSSVAAGLLFLHFFCCCGFPVLIMPLVVLIALRDKASGRGYSWLSRRLSKWIK